MILKCLSIKFRTIMKRFIIILFQKSSQQTQSAAKYLLYYSIFMNCTQLSCFFFKVVEGGRDFSIIEHSRSV